MERPTSTSSMEARLSALEYKLSNQPDIYPINQMAHSQRKVARTKAKSSFTIWIFLAALAVLVLCYDQVKVSSTQTQHLYQYFDNINQPLPNCKNNDRDDEDTLLYKRFNNYYREYRYVEAATHYKFDAPPKPECGVAPDFTKWFGMDGKQRSRLNEDKRIYEIFFKDRPKALLAHGTKGIGTYIELGAYDGVIESNTRLFDDCLGWDGLLIEGNPRVYLKTTGARPFAHRMSFAPSCREANSTVRFHTVIFTNGGIEGSAKSYDGKTTPVVDVPCGPLAPVIQDIFRTATTSGGSNHTYTTKPTVNFFSLDVEGAEFLVLDTIDFRAVHIDILMAENTNNLCPVDEVCEVREQVRAKMKTEGYTLYDDMVPNSDVFVHPQSSFQPSTYTKVKPPKRAETNITNA